MKKTFNIFSIVCKSLIVVLLVNIGYQTIACELNTGLQKISKPITSKKTDSIVVEENEQCEDDQVNVNYIHFYFNENIFVINEIIFCSKSLKYNFYLKKNSTALFLLIRSIII